MDDGSGWAQLGGLIDPRSLNTIVGDAGVVFGAGSRPVARGAMVGLSVVFILHFGLAAIFPGTPEVLGAIFCYVRYVLIVWWATGLEPLAFIRLRLA